MRPMKPGYYWVRWPTMEWEPAWVYASLTGDEVGELIVKPIRWLKGVIRVDDMNERRFGPEIIPPPAK